MSRTAFASNGPMIGRTYVSGVSVPSLYRLPEERIAPWHSCRGNRTNGFYLRITSVTRIRIRMRCKSAAAAGMARVHGIVQFVCEVSIDHLGECQYSVLGAFTYNSP